MGKSGSHVKNSEEFVKEIRGIQIDDETTMVSFDVISLFTKVPLQEAMIHISDLLHADETLEEWTTIPPDVICNLIKICLTTTYFMFEDEFYEQVEGVAMGSPLSPVVANIYMEKFEEYALRSADLKPRMWRRYVNNTFVLWTHGTD